MFKWLFDWLFDLFKNNDNIAEEMMNSVLNENSYKDMIQEELELNQKYDKNETILREFDIDPNKKTILIIDDYIGIMQTPEILINSCPVLDINDYNIIKFWGIAAGKELLYWLDENHDTRIDIGIIDVLINGIDGVDIVHKIKEHNPELEFMFYSGIDMDANEYKANKARAKFIKFLPEYEFTDKIILKSKPFETVIAPSILKLIKGE